jgi:hypothetical protein
MQKSAQPPKSPSRSQRDGFEPLADKAHKSEPFWMAALGNPAATPACKGRSEALIPASRA